MNGEFTFLLHPVRERVKIQTELQKNFINKISTQKFGLKVNFVELPLSEKADNSFPQECEFLWKTKAEQSTVEISTDRNFKNSVSFKTNGNSLKITNLLANRKYYWRVNGCLAESFITEDVSPRWIRAEGLTNVRDMGNRITQNGKRIKQGLIFRGSEMNNRYIISQNGKNVLKNCLKIKTDLDLRGPEEAQITQSPLGSDVNFCLVKASAYGEFITEQPPKITKQIFEIFANPNNYPVYFHCWNGADRTGTVAILLEALLGVSYNDIIADYELSSLSACGERTRTGEWFGSLFEQLNKFGTSADNFNKKVVKYLLSVGLSQNTLEQIKQNLLENRY